MEKEITKIINEEEAFLKVCEKNGIEMREATEEEKEKGMFLVDDEGKIYSVSTNQEVTEINEK